MKNNYLSEREMNVMQVLWKYEKPMTVTEIVESEKELTTPTVHTVLRKLLDPRAAGAVRQLCRCAGSQ